MSAILLYHHRAAAFACRKIAAASRGRLQAVQDSALPLQARIETLFRWNSYIPTRARTTINRVSALAPVQDKRLSRSLLQRDKLCPPTWFMEEDVRYPCVVRPARHTKGRKFFVCHSYREFVRARRRCKRWYATALVEKSAEYRVFALREGVLCVSRRLPPRDGGIAWNLAAGGRMVNVKRRDWPLSVLRIAVAALERLGLDFGAVDVIVDQQGTPYVLEVNTSPGLRNPYTIQCLARGFVWLAGSRPDRSASRRKKGWREFLHPALKKCNEEE